MQFKAACLNLNFYILMWRKAAEDLNSPCVITLLKQTAALAHIKKQTMK